MKIFWMILKYQKKNQNSESIILHKGQYNVESAVPLTLNFRELFRFIVILGPIKSTMSY